VEYLWICSEVREQCVCHFNAFVLTLRRYPAACCYSQTCMTDQPAFREFGKTAEKWRDLAEKRREDFAELYRSGRWRQLYTEESFRARVRAIAEICDRWTKIVEEHRQAIAEPEDDAAIERDAA